MSSATSIDRPGSGATEGKISTNDTALAAGEAARSASDATRDQFKPWHFFVLVSLIAATAAVVMARQSRPEHLVLISITIGAAGFAAAALYRMLWPLVSSDAASSVGPLTGSMRAILEREKMLTLRAIKDLEFDRAMGKVSAADFDEMAGRLRARAITLMKQLDAGGSVYREMIERELQARVRKTPAARPTPAGEDAGAPSGKPSSTDARSICACGTANDPDAAFCKRCGARLEAAAQP